jgi:hypothetical protein
MLGCREKVERPEGVLSKEEMTAVLIDIYILESQTKEIKVHFDSAKRVYNIFESRVFEKHGLQDTTYRKSFVYYQDHPELLDEIYGMLVDSLSLREKLRK